MSGIVAIVGRPNVGKSTLFNRMVEEQRAIVDDMSGVTRDRNYGKVEWNGRLFSVIDTGGYVSESDDIFEKAIREQVHIAMEQADVLIFLVDVRSGSTAGLHQLNLDAVNPPVELACHTADDQARHVRPVPVAGQGQLQGISPGDA